MDEASRVANRLAYLLHTHPALESDAAMLQDAMEDLKSVVPGWNPPADRQEAQQRWEASWDDEPDSEDDEPGPGLH